MSLFSVQASSVEKHACTENQNNSTTSKEPQPSPNFHQPLTSSPYPDTPSPRSDKRSVPVSPALHTPLSSPGRA